MYYRRQRNALLSMKSEAEGVGFKPKWGHFERLSFLNDSFTAARSTSNLNMKKKCKEFSQSASESVNQWELEEEDSFLNEEDLSQMPFETLDEILPHASHQNLPQTPILVPPNGKKRKKPMSSSDALSEVTNYLKRINDKNQIDSDGTFD